MAHHWTKKERAERNWRKKWRKSVTGMYIRNAEENIRADDDIAPKVEALKNMLNVGDSLVIKSDSGYTTHTWVVKEKYSHTVLFTDANNPNKKLCRSYTQLYMAMHGNTFDVTGGIHVEDF